MPFTADVQHDKHCLVIRFFGPLEREDFVTIQLGVNAYWQSKGYDMLLLIDDSTQFPQIPPLAPKVEEFTRESSRLDHTAPPTRLAMVASRSLAYGLARMYASYPRTDRGHPAHGRLSRRGVGLALAGPVLHGSRRRANRHAA